MAVTAVGVVSPSPATAAPSLVLDKRVSTTTPAPGAEFTYTIRFRCASTFEHCQTASITDTLPTGPELVSFAQSGGLVTGASKSSGGTITWNLKNPLTAGSTGLVTVTMKYPTCAATGFDPAPINNSARFTSSNAGSVTANAPSVDGQAVPTCAPSTPAPPPSSIAKNPPTGAVGPGGIAFWSIVVPSKPDPYTLIDTFPAGFKLQQFAGSPGTALEVDCGSGWEAWGNAYSVGAGQYGVVPPASCITTGSAAANDLVFANMTKVRATIPANVSGTVYVTGQFIAGPGEVVQNCVSADYPSAVDACATKTLDSGPGGVVGSEKWNAGRPGVPYFNPGGTPDPPAGMPQGPSDVVYQVIARVGATGDDFVNPVIADLLQPGFEFVPEADGGTNWWSSFGRAASYVDGGPFDPMAQPGCANPLFDAIENYAGTGRTLLRWTFADCILDGGTGLSPRVGVYFSARIKPTVTSGSLITNHADVMSLTGRVSTAGCAHYITQDGNAVSGTNAQLDTFDLDGDGDRAETTCPTPQPTLNIPVIATVDSSKYVLGQLDTDYSRFPPTGDTDLDGNGEYNLYLTNQGNTPLTTFDIVDVLPYVGDTSVTSPATPRGSEWGEELVSLDSVEHSLYATPDVYTPVPAGELVTGFSTSINPCRWDTADPNETNRLKAAGGAFPAIASVTAPAGCDAPNWSSTQAGARSFALRYTPAAPLAPGDTIKIHVTVKVAPGEAPAAPMNGKIAWNSFGFSAQTTAASPNDFLLSTEPIQVGLKMIDTSTTASIGDYVWLDANHDGIQNEPTGIAGVQVGLYRPGFGPDGVAGNADDNTRVDVTSTDASGEYNFWGLIPDTSTYQVRLDRPADFSTGPLKGFELTTTNAPGDDALDSDASLVGAVPTIASTPTLAAGSHTPTYDFGFFYPASLGDFVWEEIGERNGMQDVGEPPVVGATVELFDAVTNTSLGTTTTNSLGRYLFDNLNPGSYYVVFDTSTATSTGVAGAHNDPLLYEYTTPDGTGDETNDSDPDSTGRTAVITLVAGQHDPRWDAGIAPIPPPPANPASLGDYTWIDIDKDGLQGATEPVLAGVTVTLLDDLGFPIRSTTTDAAGWYEFVNLYPDREYSLKFTPPPGYTYTSMNAPDDAKDSDADPASGYTAVVPPIGNNNHDPNWDAGFVPIYSLGNLVWIDTNNDGLVSAGEAGIEGVVVNLLDGAGDPVLDLAGDPITMLTNSTGNYLFTGLLEGDYIVEIVPPTGGYISSTGAANAFEPAPDPDTVATDHDDNGTTAGATIRSAAVTLSYDAEPAGEGLTPGLGDATPDTNGNYTVDFGIFIPPPVYDLTLAKTTSTLEVNTNGNDISWTIRVQNQGTVDSKGFTVTDTMPTGTSYNSASVAYVVGGTSGSSVGTPVPVVSGQGLTFTFTDPIGLVPGGYVDITFTTNVDDITKAPFRNWAEISADSGDDDDSTPDTDTGANQTLPNDGYISVTDLATLATDGVPGVEPTGTSADADDNDDAVVGRGVILAVGDFVWYDLDRDGVQDAAELPVVGATAHLLMEDPATPGSFIDATHPDGSAVADDTTDGAGFYMFDNLKAGLYKVEFTHNQAGYRWTAADSATGTDTTDSDATFTLESDATATTAAFLLAVGETNVAPVTATDATELNAGSPLVAAQIDRSRDAGIWIPVAVGDYVWYDTDHDGLQDSTELTAEDVTVTLLNPDGSPAKDADGVDVAAVQTDVDGNYVFDRLLPGDYKIVFSTLPAGWGATTQDSAGLLSDDIDSDADPATLTTDVFTLSATTAGNMEANADPAIDAGFIDPTIDLGLFQSVSLGDLVWIDTDRDGQFDIGTELPIEDVKVELLNAAGTAAATDVDGADVASVLTDPDGRYSFTNLLPGDYKVRFTLPSGYVWTGSNTVGSDGLDSDPLYTVNTDATATTATVTLTNTAVTDPDTTTAHRSVTDPTIDAGVIPVLSMGDLVWIDTDSDGQFDIGVEAPIEDVKVELLDAAGTAAAKDAQGVDIASVLTDADGRYSFTNLLPGDYQVRFTLPTGYVWTGSNTAGSDGLDSDATYTANSDATALAPFTLVAAPVTDPDTTTSHRLVTNPTIDAGVVPLLSLGDLVWIDTDMDGQFDIGVEALIKDVKVELLTAAGAIAKDGQGVDVASVLTDVDGRYEFDNLLPGDYRVRFTLPTGYVWTGSNTVGSDGLDSDPLFTVNSDATATTATLTLTSTSVIDTDTTTARRAVTNPTIDAGVIPLVSLGDLVWVDSDRDGQFDIGVEAPIKDVKVELLNAAGTAAAKDAQGADVASVLTDIDGRYSFGNLLPGDYKVRFTLPTGYVWTGSNTVGSDGLDSDPTYTTNKDATATTAAVTLTATPVTDPDTTTSHRLVTNPTIDAGVVPIVNLGDLVWYDANRDGIYDPATESGLAGVTVTLTNSDGTPAKDADGVNVGPDTTDVDGRYSFENLLPGTYKVTFTLPNGYEWTKVNTPGDDTLDSDAMFTTMTDATATTGDVVLLAPVSDSDPDGLDLTNPSVDAGVWFPFALGDKVWFDLDHNGAQDPTETVVVGATAHLLMEDPAVPGSFIDAVDADGDPVADDTTDADGLYLFDNLLPGVYRVEFTHNQAGYRWTVTDAVTAGDVSDSDATFTAETDLVAVTGDIELSVDVVAGVATPRPGSNVRATTPTDDTTYGAPLRASYVDPTNDAGIWMPLAVGDYLWYDLDRDGMQDSTEPGVNGVTVELVNADGSPALDANGVAVPSTTTVAHAGDDGWYSFGNLVPGDYKVKFSNWPAGWAPTIQLADAALSGIDSNPGNTGVTPTFTLSVDAAVGNMEPNADPSVVGYLIDPTIDMGIFQSITLGDLVWFDADRDGVKDLAEVGVEGVRAHLTMEDPDVPGTFFDAVDADGNAVADEFTDVDGRYSFTNLISTSYKVTFTLPSGYEWTVSNTPGDDTLDSDVTFTTTTDATATTGATPVSALAPVTDSDPAGLELTNPSVDAGIWFPLALGDVVWFDLDHDGVQDATEAPVVGATAHLTMEDPATPGSFITAKDADGVDVADDTTDADGLYLFDNLLPGTYRVTFTHNQPGYRWTVTDAAAATDATDSDVTYVAESAVTATTGDIELTVAMVGGVATPSGNIRATAAADDTTYGSVLRASFVDPTNDAGIWMPLAVGDFVWYDIDHNGIQDELEDAVEGVTVTLLNADGTPAVDADGLPVPATTTDVDGWYVFDRLLPGDYKVVFSTLPAGFVATLPNEGVEDGDDSDADPVTLTSHVFTLSVLDADGNMESNSNGDIDAFLIDPTVDLGIWAPVAIGDVVWYDVDRDGIQDEDEDPIEGITVTLLDGEGAPAVDADGEPVAPVVTDEDGHYVFDNLLVGEYQVQFTLPTGAVVTYQAVEDDEAVDSNPDDTGLTPVFLVDLDEPNVRDIEDTDGTTVATRIDPTIDAGIWFPLAVGDYVWFDLDRDGIQETGELPVAGVTVALLMEDPETPGSFIPAVDADGEPVAPTVTDANGHYVFDYLLEGTYKVKFTNLPANYQVTRQAMGADRAVDSNPDSTGLTPAFELTFDSVLVREAVDGDGLEEAAFIDPTIDMGIWIPVAVGDYVWNDVNHNGTQDSGEAPVVGVTVTLLNADGTPAVDAEGAAVVAASTDAAGHYVFDNLLPGSYVIQFSNLPAGFEYTTPTVGAVSTDSNADATGRTAVFTLTPAGGDMRAPVAADGVTKAAMINPTIDAGIWKPLAVGDVVWVDYNRNGIQDLNELPVKDVKVELLNPDGTPAVNANGATVAPVKTDANGHYVFDNLLPGDYKIRFSELPRGGTFTTQNGTGSTTANDSNPDQTTGVTPVFNLNPADPNVRAPQTGDGTSHHINPTIDAGLVRLDGASGGLPATGGNTMRPIQLGLLLLGAGATLLATTRRRKRQAA